MDSNVVIIKVKYEDKLRRFSAIVTKKGLNLTMDGLMAKIRSLFTFAPGSKLQLTYVDEDGDLVSLMDDDDLFDVWRQSLNPLRVTVSLTSEKNGGSIPLISPSSLDFQLLNSAISELLKTIPEPLREQLSKLSSDLASTSPNLVEILDSLSKLCLSYLNKLSEIESSTTVESSKTKGDDESTKDSEVHSVPEYINLRPVKVFYGLLDEAKEVIAPSRSGGDSTPSKEVAPNKGKKVKKQTLNELKMPYGGVPSYPSIDPINTNDPLVNWGSVHINRPMCPYTGMPIEDPFCDKKSDDGTFHTGVQCDGCGVHPITGPRFKSKVKEDYDLCNICFGEIENFMDYMRIDKPILYYQPSNFKGLYNYHSRKLDSTLPPKLDSRFIEDMNIADGTLMAPLTKFKKIWKLRNNGTTVWPQGCQLVWIGGDKLTQNLSINLKIPDHGLPVHHEIDVAVDCIAPELPGRYISYWRLASPSGQKFGQRVWVLLQVDASMKEPIVHETVHRFNLNLPPPSVTVPESEKSKLVVSTEKKNLENIPIIDLTEDTPPGTPTTSSTLLSVPKMEDIISNKEEKIAMVMEESLLKQLEDMGFKEIELNKKVLRRNKYHFEQAVDDLCCVSEWDPMLEELQEMGFHDKETNKRLLQKNNGSLKRVVMDLIAGERD